jgi:hypothetical protein
MAGAMSIIHLLLESVSMGYNANMLARGLDPAKLLLISKVSTDQDLSIQPSKMVPNPDQEIAKPTRSARVDWSILRGQRVWNKKTEPNAGETGYERPRGLGFTGD